jgi:hypothetical protein
MSIQELVEKYLGEKKVEKKVSAFDKVRKPTAPPTKKMGDKSKYERKDKHKKKLF